jgi:TonB family protein
MVASTRQLAMPEALVAAFESFTQQQITLEDLHTVVARTVSADPAYVEIIQSMFDHELESQRLSIADYGELVVELGEVLSEDVATDCSALNPDESGVYRIVAPGQLVPDETDIEQLLDSQSEPGEVREAGLSADTGQLPPLTDVVPEPAQQEDARSVIEIGPGFVLRDRFRLEEQLGGGSMGTVFRATDLLLEESGAADPCLALKIINPALARNPGALRALQNEIIASQRLSHPNIIHVRDFDRDGEISFVTMELLQGRTLAGLLDEHGLHPLDSVLADTVVKQLGEALAYAHRQGVVHADLKPANVFLCDSGELKLLDFGLARIGRALREDEDLLEGVLTPAYASCERLEHRKASPQDDIYSFGCIVYRMLVGQRPFGSLSALDAEASHKKLLPNAAIPRHRFPILRDALAFRAAGRTATISSFTEHYFAPDVLSADEESPVLTEKPELVFDTVPEFEVTRSESTAHMSLDVEQPLVRQAEPDRQSPEPEPVADPETAEAPAQAAETSEPEPVRKKFVRSRKRAKELAERPEMTARMTARELISKESLVRSWRRKLTRAVQGLSHRLTANKTRFVILGLLCGALAALIVTLGLGPRHADLALVAQSSQPAEAPEPEAYAIVVMPTDESVLVIPPDFYAEVRPARSITQSQRQSAVRSRQQDPAPGTITVMAAPASGATVVERASARPLVSPAPVAEVAVGGVATQVAPDPFPVSVVTDVDTSVGQSAFVTDVSTASLSPDVEGTFVTDVVPESAAEGLSGVVTTVAARRPVPAQQGVGSRTPDPDGPLPLSALEFARYVEPEFPELRGQGSGWVDVSFSVDERGRTAAVEVTDSSLPRRFNRAALNAVNKWRFEPYQRNGAAVTVDSAVRLRVE